MLPVGCAKNRQCHNLKVFAYFIGLGLKHSYWVFPWKNNMPRKALTKSVNKIWTERETDQSSEVQRRARRVWLGVQKLGSEGSKLDRVLSKIKQIPDKTSCSDEFGKNVLTWGPGGAKMSRTPKQTLYLHIVWIIYLLQVSISLSLSLSLPPPPLNFLKIFSCDPGIEPVTLDTLWKLATNCTISQLLSAFWNRPSFCSSGWPGTCGTLHTFQHRHLCTELPGLSHHRWHSQPF